MDKDVVALIRYIRELGIVDLGKGSAPLLVEGVSGDLTLGVGVTARGGLVNCEGHGGLAVRLGTERRGLDEGGRAVREGVWEATWLYINGRGGGECEGTRVCRCDLCGRSTTRFDSGQGFGVKARRYWAKHRCDFTRIR